MEHKECDGHEKATSVALNQENLLENLDNSVASLYLLLGINLSADLSIFQVDVLVISWKLTDLAQVLQTLFSLVVTDQVPSALRGEEDHSAEENPRSDLDAERCLPLIVGVVLLVVWPS